MAVVADQFQARELNEHCAGQFRGGLWVGNGVGRLLAEQESGLRDLDGGCGDGVVLVRGVAAVL